jgi:hypothetical protein
MVTECPWRIASHGVILFSLTLLFEWYFVFFTLPFIFMLACYRPLHCKKGTDLYWGNVLLLLALCWFSDIINNLLLVEFYLKNKNSFFILYVGVL